MTDLEKVYAAFERVADGLLAKVQAASGAGTEVERIALDSVHKAFEEVVTSLDVILAEAAGSAPEPKTSSKTPASASDSKR